jgi:hypothetical protein
VRTVIVILSSAVLALGCKDKPKNQASPTPGSGSAPAGSATGSGSAAAPKQSEIVLPKGDGTPPIKTTKPLAKDVFEKLSKIEVDGFGKDVRRLQDNGLDIRYLTKERPKIAVTLTVRHCFDCIPMELERWQQKGDSLKVLLAPELRKAPDTTFELAATELNGATMMSTYQVGYLFGPDETGQQVGAYSNAYALYYNDGVNDIRAVAEYKDDVPASREDMVRLAPREDLEKVAKSLLDAYTHAWQ